MPIKFVDDAMEERKEEKWAASGNWPPMPYIIP